MKAYPSQVIATCFALSAFAVAVIAGLYALNDAMTVLLRAMLAMLVCYPAGYVAGVVCERAVYEHERQFAESDQSEGSPEAGADDEQPVDNEEILTI